LEEIVKTLGPPGITLAFMWIMVKWMMDKLQQQELRVEQKESKLEASNEKTVLLLTGVIEKNTEALRSAGEIIDENTKVITELRQVIDKLIVLVEHSK